jgi:hypothetical protein
MTKEIAELGKTADEKVELQQYWANPKTISSEIDTAKNTKEEIEAEKTLVDLEKHLNNPLSLPDCYLKTESTNDALEKEIKSTDELKETEIVTIEIEKQFVINTGNYSSITQRYSLKREGRTKNITNFLQQTDDIISKKVNEQFNKIKASL